MKLYNLKDFIGGWFVGKFVPTIIPTENVEVSIKRYSKGDYDKKHLHKIANEITVIISGLVEMNGIQYKDNDILLIEKEEATDFKVIEDTITCVVKIPSVKNDKYLV